jgi:hypothetical protein
MLGTSFLSRVGDGSLVATAIHNGHCVRPAIETLLALSEDQRLREEDPYTGLLTNIAPTQLVGLRSRFEVDLNRPREKAVYLRPEDSWGLQVWKEYPSAGTIACSLQAYDAFYEHAEQVLCSILRREGRFIVLDLHSYNHRRAGPHGPVADPRENPEINIGTGSADRKRWGHVIDGFIDQLRQFDFMGRRLDVRENVKFQGGNFAQWIHRRFQHSGLAIAVEFKKIFMDEWTGALNQPEFSALHQALRFASAGLAEARSVR